VACAGEDEASARSRRARHGAGSAMIAGKRPGLDVDNAEHEVQTKVLSGYRSGSRSMFGAR
jgi:hypothetical protein